MAAPFLEAARCRACASRRACIRSRLRSLGLAQDNLAESAALNSTGDLTNAQFPMLNSHPKWMSDCQMFHRCKTRSHYRTNSKNDSLNSQQRSLVLQDDSPRPSRADMSPTRSCGQARLEPQTMPRDAERKVVRISFTRCGSCKKNLMKRRSGSASWPKVP